MAVDQATEAKIVAVEEYVETELDRIGDLSERQKDALVRVAIGLPATPEGMPDIRAAVLSIVTGVRNPATAEWRRLRSRLLTTVGPPPKRTRRKGTRKKKGAATHG